MYTKDQGHSRHSSRQFQTYSYLSPTQLVAENMFLIVHNGTQDYDSGQAQCHSHLLRVWMLTTACTAKHLSLFIQYDTKHLCGSCINLMHCGTVCQVLLNVQFQSSRLINLPVKFPQYFHVTVDRLDGEIQTFSDYKLDHTLSSYFINTLLWY